MTNAPKVGATGEIATTTRKAGSPVVPIIIGTISFILPVIGLALLLAPDPQDVNRTGAAVYATIIGFCIFGYLGFWAWAISIARGRLPGGAGSLVLFVLGLPIPLVAIVVGLWYWTSARKRRTVAWAKIKDTDVEHLIEKFELAANRSSDHPWVISDWLPLTAGQRLDWLKTRAPHFDGGLKHTLEKGYFTDIIAAMIAADAQYKRSGSQA